MSELLPLVGFMFGTSLGLVIGYMCGLDRRVNRARKAKARSVRRRVSSVSAERRERMGLL